MFRGFVILWPAWLELPGAIPPASLLLDIHLSRLDEAGRFSGVDTAEHLLQSPLHRVRAKKIRCQSSLLRSSCIFGRRNISTLQSLAQLLYLADGG
jgi:hypothetical protein